MLIDKDDLSFLKRITKAVLDSSKIQPGQRIVSSSGPNNTKGVLIRPGGRDDYPAFWIRDYSMSLETGMVTGKEQKHMLLLTASSQCDQSWITKGGSMVPFGALPDHIRIDDGLPIYFPGTYDYEDQGNKFYGMTPPYCDQFYFIHMAYYYSKSTADYGILSANINGRKLIDRLEIAFGVPPARLENQIVYTDTNFRGVDFGFRDGIVITGDLCFSSILKFWSARELAELFQKLGNESKTKKYRSIAEQIKKAIPKVFADKKGFLKASTGISGQPDVWSTGLAVYLNILEGNVLKNACKALSDAYLKGKISYNGSIRHVPTTDDFSDSTAWERTDIPKNKYQNGSYWGTATGWVCYAIAKADRDNAKRHAKEYITDLRRNDFRKGPEYGAPYECFYPEVFNANPLYLTTVACPYIVFNSPF